MPTVRKLSDPIKIASDYRQAVELLNKGELVAFSHPWNRPVPRGGRALTIVKVMCLNRKRLLTWARANGIPEDWLHLSGRKGIPHFDLWGCIAARVLRESRHS